MVGPASQQPVVSSHVSAPMGGVEPGVRRDRTGALAVRVRTEQLVSTLIRDSAANVPVVSLARLVKKR